MQSTKPKPALSSEDELIILSHKPVKTRSEPETPPMPKKRRPRKPTIYDRPGTKGLPDVVESDSETQSEELVVVRDRPQVNPKHKKAEPMEIEPGQDEETEQSESDSETDVSYSTDPEPNTPPRAAAAIARRKIAQQMAGEAKVTLRKKTRKNR